MQSEGYEYCGGYTRLKIQQSHGPERWPYSLRVRAPHFASKVSYSAGASTDDYAGLRGLKAQQVRSPGQRPGYHAPFPTPCKGKSKNQPFAHTFALTGRRRLCIDTQGVALGYGLTALSGRSRRGLRRTLPLKGAHI